MRLHHLAVVGFGPFAQREEVDLDELAEGGLFLLHGATGAGKTSVLDAVCYALYGVVPGVRQKAGRLRSDHAAPDLRTSVQLELTIAGRRLRVTREPAWLRAKKRGSGATTAPARCLLEEQREGTWTTLSTRNDEAGHLLRSLLGLSAEQFCQVVLLPQGAFAEFLRADPEARRTLLEQLFDTSRFSRAEQWLVERRRCLRAERDRAREHLGRLLARTAQVAGLDDPPSAAEEDPAAWTAELLHRAQAGQEQAVGALAGAREGWRAAQAAHATGVELADRRRRWEELGRAWATLQDQAEDRERTRRRLHDARRAAPVAALQEVLVSAARAEHAAGAAVRQAVADHADLADDEAVRGPRELRRRARVLREEATALDGLVALAREHEAAVAALARARRDGAAAAAAHTGALRRLHEAVAACDRLEVAVSVLTPVAATVDGARTAVEAARARLEAALRRDVLEDQLRQARGSLVEIVQVALTARQHWLDLRQARLDGMAAELAGALVPGGCCPVCGSAEHPAPTTAPPGAVTSAEEKAAERRHQAAETDRAAVEQEVAALERRLAEARALAGGAEVALPQLQESEQQAAAALARARRAEEQLGDLHGRQQEAVAAAEHLRSAASDLQAALAAAVAREQDLSSRVDRLAQHLPAGESASSLRARQEAVVGQADRCELVAGLVEDRVRCSAAAEEARRQLEEAARDLGFPDAEAALAAVLPQDQQSRLADALARLVAEEMALTAARADDQLRAAALAEAPDLEALAASLAAAQDGLDRSLAAGAAAARTAQDLDRLDAAVRDAAAALAPLAAEHAVVESLSRLVEGSGADNLARVRLSSYVLAARLREVAEAASERLLRMTSGRYRLVHADDPLEPVSGGTAGGSPASGASGVSGASGASGSSAAAGAPGASPGRVRLGRGGLTLRVVDAWTGAERDTTTLSGGESFAASLALALGLADVVGREAGGARMDTLFVDEGFGSLDEETLDEVMDVLDGLRSGGRAVGIVSHVADLRSRIPHQLHVRKDRSGSSLQVRVGTAT